MACDLCDRWHPVACDKCGKVVPQAFVAIETKDGVPIDDPGGFMWCVVCHGNRVNAALSERAEAEIERLNSDVKFFRQTIAKWAQDPEKDEVINALKTEVARLTDALRVWQLGIGDTEMEAENKRLRSELDHVKAEWAVAMRDIVALKSAAIVLGSRGGSANTPAQQAHRDTVMGKGRPRLPEITDAQIEAVRGDAAQACNTSLIALCNRALAGSARARRRCRQMVRDAEEVDC